MPPAILTARDISTGHLLRPGMVYWDTLDALVLNACFSKLEVGRFSEAGAEHRRNDWQLVAQTQSY